MPGILREVEPSNLSTPIYSESLASTRNGSTTAAAAPPKASIRVKFIPPQTDLLSGTSTEASRSNPIRLLFRDTRVLLGLLGHLAYIVMPMRTKDKSAEMYPSARTVLDFLLMTWLSLAELVLLFYFPAAILFLPGFVSMTGFALACLLLYLISWPLQGTRVVYPDMDEAAIDSAKKHENERWLFINGCITSHSGLQSNVNRLTKTFGRPVIGIHNQTYGLIADLLECLIQRCLAFSTKDVRISYDYVKACLLDPTVTKVVLIGHSQGGIIVSLVIDALFADLPPSTISKLEIYTFGNAASHFNNPCLTSQTSSPSPTTSPLATHTITHIEHYVNELELIPRWGVLYNVSEILDNRYSGKIFVRMGASGHLFNQHYLGPMFPLDPSMAGEFLDQVVDVDEKLEMRRRGTAVQGSGALRRESSGKSINSIKGLQVVSEQNGDRIKWGDGESIPVGMLVDDQGLGDDLMISFSQGQTEFDAKGKTVSQLSRLWRYAGGGNPLD
jgi:hypothetical protein